MTYDYFKTTCKRIANEAEISVKVKYYDMSRYGRQDWFQAAFEVDAFGGIVAIISYYEDNLWYESSLMGKKLATRLSEVEEWLPFDIADTRASRTNVEMFNCD